MIKVVLHKSMVKAVCQISIASVDHSVITALDVLCFVVCVDFDNNALTHS